jgi:hypothetical protein
MPEPYSVPLTGMQPLSGTSRLEQSRAAFREGKPTSGVDASHTIVPAKPVYSAPEPLKDVFGAVILCLLFVVFVSIRPLR